jgi:glutamate synthase domain-containing protein 1
MCGIVGLFAKTPAMHEHLGDHLSTMLIEMTDRGPDSAGVAVYRNPAAPGGVKLSLYSADPAYPWRTLAKDLAEELGDKVDVEVRGSHAVVVAHEAFEVVRTWLGHHHPELRIVSAGGEIEIFKEMGLPATVVERFALRDLHGSHALGHTRMATESAVTTQHSHPFSTGLDLCLVHNGSLSNHNRLRAWLRKRDIEIQTDNDTEVAAGYLTWRLREGATLEQALEAAVKDLDGFYTFAIGTRDGFAVLRDPIACKHAVLAETDDWVAMATEFRAIAPLPGADRARIWEPAPATVYSWSRGRNDGV